MPPAPALRTRKNQMSLTPKERDRYVKAVLKMKSDGIYDWYIQTHIDSMAELTNGDMNMWAHQRPAFLPWHRQFILNFENDMRAADAALTGKATSDLALPYWDWTIDRSKFPYLVFGWVWMESFMGPNGSGSAANNRVQGGPFKDWPMFYKAGSDYQPLKHVGETFLQRSFGAVSTADSLPSEAEWIAASNVGTYDASYWDSDVGIRPPTMLFLGVSSFRNALEGFVGFYDNLSDLTAATSAAAADPNWTPRQGLHNRVHVWVGGQMSSVYWSPNDPVFFLHHCNVDRLWAQWWSLNPKRTYLPAAGEPSPTDPVQGKIDLTGHHLTDPMPPWDGTHAGPKGTTGNLPIVRPSDVLNHTTLGYRYDTDSPSLTATGHP
jgi:tyrosinase